MPRPRKKAFSDVDVSETESSVRPSITAVARRAGVSIATVSRVLNKRSTVTPELELRVKRAIRQTGYVPNVSARALSSGRSRLFGVLISNLTNPFFPDLLQEFEERAVALGYEVLVASTAYDVQRMSSCIERMLERKVDGVAVMTFGMEGPLLSRFVDRGVPLVFMDTAPPSANTFAVEVDYDTGIQQAVEHLVALGHRRIGFVSGPEQQVSVAKRRSAVDRALLELGVPRSADLTYQGDHSVQSGSEAFHAFRKLKRPPTAILCSNDLSAVGVLLAAKRAGTAIPKELSIIGFDGIELGSYMEPPLTSISMSRRAIAECAVNALWSSVENLPPPTLQVCTQLLKRSTTGPPHTPSAARVTGIGSTARKTSRVK